MNESQRANSCAPLKAMNQTDAAAISPIGAAGATQQIHAGSMAVTVHRDYGEIEKAYARLSATATVPALQSPQWVRLYQTFHGGHFAHVCMGMPGHELLILPLEMTRRHGVNVLGYAGGSHANGNFPVIDRALWHDTATLAAGAVAAALRQSNIGADVVILERQLGAHDGIANPFVTPASAPSPNLALAADLSQGFDHLMSVISGKRKRKKNRSQARKFEAAGGYEFARATTQEDVDRLLDSFFESKELRFRASGITNVFGSAEIQRFLRALFKGELGSAKPRFFLDALKVGGRIRAVTASSVTGDRVTCEFASICEDELAQHSPGEFLFFRNIEQAAADGYVTYDFGVGDEHYKRMWCNVETTHFDTVIPVTAKGAAYGMAWRTIAAAKRRIKRDRMLWPLVKRLRQRMRGQKPAEKPADAED